MSNSNFVLSGPSLIGKLDYSSLGEYFFKIIPEYGATTALINAETGEELTYKKLFEKSLKLSLTLGKLGLKINDRIAICSENSINFVTTVLSSFFFGTTICLFNPSYTEKELLHVLNISKPKYIFVSKLVLERVQKVAEDLTWDLKLILLNQDPKLVNFQDLISKISENEIRNFQLSKIEEKESIRIIAFSSGTTGLAKGVMLSDKNILSSISGQLQSSNPLIKLNSVVSGLLPMFHIYGLDVFLLTIAFNSKLVIFSQFEERGFLRNVEKYRIQTMFLVPTIFVILSKSLIGGEHDLSSVEHLICAAAAFPSGVSETVKKLFKNPKLFNVYGMTETSCTVTYSSEETKNQSIGVLQPACIAKIIPLDGHSKKALGPNCNGELCFKGDLIMKGYCGDEEATKAVIDEDGFLHTGDVGYYDDDGYFYIVDRIKDLIKYKGFQVPPVELEDILLGHPAIKDAAVIGLVDEIAGELPLAFVVRQPGINVTSSEIIQYVNGRISSQKHLRGGVRFIDSIPKNPSGKILRRELRKLLESRECQKK